MDQSRGFHRQVWVNRKRGKEALEEILVYGAGGFAKEVAGLVEDCQHAGQDLRVVAFVDIDPGRFGSLLNDLPVLGEEEAHHRFPQAKVVIGIGSPKLREIITRRMEPSGLSFVSFTHPSVHMSRFVEIRRGNHHLPRLDPDDKHHLGTTRANQSRLHRGTRLHS